MISNKHIDDIKNIVGSVIDDIITIQSSLNEGTVTPEVVRDFYASLDYAEFRMAAIMGSAGIEIDGAYTQNEDE